MTFGTEAAEVILASAKIDTEFLAGPADRRGRGIAALDNAVDFQRTETILAQCRNSISDELFTLLKSGHALPNRLSEFFEFRI